MGKKTKYQKLQDKLFREKKSAWVPLERDKSKIFKFAESYKKFLANSKTERTAVKTIVSELKKTGFKDIHNVKKLNPGDKIYLNHKGKSIIAAVIGKNHNSVRLLGSHLDSPRLDVKPHPVYEEKGLSLMKTHYYGGIKKYQWTNVDLALYGVIHTKKGKKIEFSVGEKEDEQRFIVSDLLPHLAKKQLEKPGYEIVEGEQLNVYLGNIPVDDKKVKEKIKLNILDSLNKKYGITEEDFNFAELNFVPAEKPKDIGFDRSLIAGYGHDDKAGSYASLRAIVETKNPETTIVSYFSDKEEIGSTGDTGAYSFVLLDFAEMLTKKLSLKISASELLRISKAISADVGSGVNPSFSDVHEEKNAALLGNGVIIEKYTGAGGKYSANDASAEYMQEIREVLSKNNINWQIGELGKVDVGGGGTIALFLSRYGMDTIDIGPPVLGMHSPREVLSKVDLYETYRAYKAFFSN